MGFWIYQHPSGARLVLEVSTSGPCAVLSGYQARAGNLSPALEQIAAVMRDSFGRQFAMGGNPAWQPLSRNTIDARRVGKMLAGSGKSNAAVRPQQRGKTGAGAILISAGRLRDSYRQKSAPGHIERIDAKAGTVVMGSSLKTPDGRYSLAAIHQHGTKPYTIRAKYKKALAFNGIVVRSVQHPGVPARPLRASGFDRARIRSAVVAHFAGKPFDPI